MSIKEIKSATLYKEYAVEIPYQEINGIIDEKINEIQPTVSIPGFRKGKAPISIVRKKYEDNIISEAIERLVQDNVLWKPPGGKTLGFHQDAAYDDWLIPQTMMTCWMSLDDTSKETGTLEYIKGSHKWGLQPPKGEFHSPEDYKKELNIFAEKNNKQIE